jgi:ABC-type Fe3+-hydroxamate transport system substrate-binding protein
MKKVTIGGLILLTLALSACHSTTESEIVITSDSVKISDSITTTSVFDKTAKDTIILDTIKK